MATRQRHYEFLSESPPPSGRVGLLRRRQRGPLIPPAVRQHLRFSLSDLLKTVAVVSLGLSLYALAPYTGLFFTAVLTITGFLIWRRSWLSRGTRTGLTLTYVAACALSPLVELVFGMLSLSQIPYIGGLALVAVFVSGGGILVCWAVLVSIERVLDRKHHSQTNLFAAAGKAFVFLVAGGLAISEHFYQMGYRQGVAAVLQARAAGTEKLLLNPRYRMMCCEGYFYEFSLGVLWSNGFSAGTQATRAPRTLVSPDSVLLSIGAVIGPPSRDGLVSSISFTRPIADTDLEDLVLLYGIDDVNLSGQKQLTDSCLMYLEDERLYIQGRINLQGTSITKAGAARLKIRHPKVQIVPPDAQPPWSPEKPSPPPFRWGRVSQPS